MRSILLLVVISCTIACHNPNLSNQDTASATDPDWALLPFEKVDAANPVLLPDSTLQFHCPVRNEMVQWAAKDVFNPAAVVKDDTLFLIFRAEDKVGKYAGTSRIGLAYSTNGLHFTKYPEPVLFPQNDTQHQWEWEGGCEDPRVVADENGTYFMTYTAYDGKTARLLVASSPDLRKWTKHGPAFAKAHNGKYLDTWSKSGAVVSEYKNGSPVAVKVAGKYWMYWGDVNIWAATSDDLVHWTPVLYEGSEKYEGELRHIAAAIPEVKTVFGPRTNKFDSDLVEPGPPALLTDKGIVLIYNSRNVPAIGDTTLPEGTYAASQILLDKKDPSRVLQRLEHYFIKPEKPYEISGQIANVCFVEGLVQYQKKWFLYYGTADSKIAVATKD